ncbi:threonine aldolase family protein [Propioniciclava sp. MC1683]|uniref:threonine aldolase family protein n=1 Tax=Propioniciclava sp. MC1683 TaxID=2760309 RepID=UPI0016039F38|nr:threonine aldolase family protein [Propioniciclava sp. MC1683]MBB1500157.1 threonine aldolase family protein [Propioniciclava sp. MC1683]
MIDLRSDTLTQPSEAMRAAMAAAPVGDDVYAEDPTIGELEQRVAELLGHEAGLFCATGSLANVLGVAQHVRPGQEVLCDSGAHIARAEMGAHGALTGVTMRTWVTHDGRTEPELVEELLAPDAGPYLVSTACVAIENTHNFGGGTVQPLDALTQTSALCRDAGVRLHLDGARLWNAHVATGTPLADYGTLFDTVSVCFSKGLGAPVGSVLVGSAEAMANARVLRKRLGGGWRQAGLLAAGCLYALDHHVERLADDHAAASAFAAAVTAGSSVTLADPETNIVVVPTGSLPATEVVARAAARGVRVSTVGARVVRAATHLDVTTAQCADAGAILAEVLQA